MAQHGKNPQPVVAKHKFAAMHLMGGGEGGFTCRRLGDLADKDLQAVVFNARFMLRHAKSPDSRNA